MTYMYGIAITYGVVSQFFDLCREYQQEILPQKMAEILREYADRLDE